MKNAPTTVSLAEFINIIKALEQAGLIILDDFAISDDEKKLRISSNAAEAFGRLDYVHNKMEPSKYVKPSEYFDKFMRAIINASRHQHYHYPCHRKANTEYLLGFLLFHNIHIKFDNRTINLENFVWNSLPSVEFNHFKYGHSYFSTQIAVPNTPFDFLNENWRKSQNYPSLPTLCKVWTDFQKQLHEIEQRKLQEEMQKRAQEIAQANWIQTHRFDGLSLSLEQFSYVLEGYIKSNQVKLFNNTSSFFNHGLMLSPSLSHVMMAFSQTARNSSHNQQNYQLSANLFCVMMKLLICSAKYQQGSQAAAAQKLLGFLLHHNIHVQHDLNYISMGQIFWCEATDQEKYAIANNLQHNMVYIFPQWQAFQHYPSKADLERLLSMQPSQQIGYKQPTFLNAYQNAITQQSHQTQDLAARNSFQIGIGYR